ncbi:PepSY domain-containing protein [Micromonospora sp. CPCC 205371]|nr:PepSY domain-containing protein [Micromonospora sp. CPCC 205371]
MTRKTILALAAGGVAALAITGTALAAGEPSSPPPTSVMSQTTTPTTPTSQAPDDDAVGHERAVEIALAEAGGGRVTEVEREWEHDRPAWKVEIVNGATEHEVYVDRENGQIVKSEREAVDDDDRVDDGTGRDGGDDHDDDSHDDDRDDD